jgi:hypothetical protein
MPTSIRHLKHFAQLFIKHPKALMWSVAAALALWSFDSRAEAPTWQVAVHHNQVALTHPYNSEAPFRASSVEACDADNARLNGREYEGLPWPTYYSGTGYVVGVTCALRLHFADGRSGGAPGYPYRGEWRCADHNPPVNGLCGCPDGQRYDANAKQCVADKCPVSPITPITDPDFEQYENGRYSHAPDLEHLTSGTAAGAQCIVREARNAGSRARTTSGYRPPIYQTHILEVYDKWQLLEHNEDPVCAEVKASVLIEWNKHGPFAHQPGTTSRHSTGRAVDISLSNYGVADSIAARCQMIRNVPDDRPHFEPLR